MMKKLMILMTALLLCTSFIACGYKDTHVKIIDENTLKYKGEKYILVDGESEPFINVYPVFSTQVYITERGTPGFLAKLLCEDSIGTIAKSYISDNGYFIQRNFRGIYCREDIYNDLDQLLNEAEYDRYVYQYDVDGELATYTLTRDEMDAVDRAFAETAPVASYDLGYMPASTATIDLKYLDNDTMTMTELHRLMILEYGYCFTVLCEDGTTEYYIVPEELYPEFDSMTEAYKEAV